MVYIKKLVMRGFKSFPKKTEIPFSKGINVIIGPNGSGKSNISDALCFVLGRLNVKSMRAVKSRNLIFLGTKDISPAKEATVEIVFDNSNNVFSLDKKEISIKRILRKNGQSIYKINNEKKTRQEILTLLAQAGIDPNGFNIVLQGQIQNFVRMHNEERRKIIEEVSGIAIYEAQKEKSIRELNKTEEKLKEVISILKERTSYLNNLEKERQQALRFKKLQSDVQKYKASIIFSDLRAKQKENNQFEKEITSNYKEIEKLRKKAVSINNAIEELKSKIDSINYKIQESTGFEQEKLNQEIANLRADIAGLNVKVENYEKNLSEINRKKQELESSIKESQKEINDLKKESPLEKKSEEIDEKKKELEELETKRKRFYSLKSQLKSLKEVIEDKKNLLQGYKNESDFLLKSITALSESLFDRNSSNKKLQVLKASLNEKKEILDKLNSEERNLEKISFSNETEVEKQRETIKNLPQTGVCPLCKSRITEEHINSIKKEVHERIQNLKKQIDNSDKKLAEIGNKKKILIDEIQSLDLEIKKREKDLMQLSKINEKTEQLKSLNNKINELDEEILKLKRKRNNLQKNIENSSNIEEKYEKLMIELQELSLRNEETINSEISFKIKELERTKISLKQLFREEEDIKESLQESKKSLNKKEKLLKEKREQEEKLTIKFKKMIKERDEYASKIREKELEISEINISIHNIEQKINDLKIDKARVDAEIENLEKEMLQYQDVEIVRSNKEFLIEKLTKTEETLSKIGSVNMRALEVYDSVKEEYEKINQKVEVIMKEKESILKIIHEVDIKKKKAFMKTFNELNEIFSRNFSKLSAKGQVFLELENKKDPFAGGVNVIVKLGHGKYFDITSLSGGEQTLVALSLIFAIQELNPYYFYILDEIDAALDKRNSQRLAALLKKYMQKGQYIVISHNDEVISEAVTLYGVSMHEGVSKIVSLKL